MRATSYDEVKLAPTSYSSEHRSAKVVIPMNKSWLSHLPQEVYLIYGLCEHKNSQFVYMGEKVVFMHTKYPSEHKSILHLDMLVLVSERYPCRNIQSSPLHF